MCLRDNFCIQFTPLAQTFLPKSVSPTVFWTALHANVLNIETQSKKSHESLSKHFSSSSSTPFLSQCYHNPSRYLNQKLDPPVPAPPPHTVSLQVSTPALFHLRPSSLAHSLCLNPSSLAPGPCLPWHVFCPVACMIFLNQNLDAPIFKISQ